VFSEELYLRSDIAKSLYEKYAKDLPIIDYHCHLSPKELCENKRYSNIGELWLAHDHYKWRAMRAFGVDEELITGGAGWREKFIAFARIVPYLVGNPLYIWCALELKRFFQIGEPLCGENANAIYDKTAGLINEHGMTPSYFVGKSNVEYIATTDDPADDLSYHGKIAADGYFGKCRIVPAFRPDKAMGIEKPGFAAYVHVLEEAAGIGIHGFKDMIKALELRLADFKAAGSTLNDNGLTGFAWIDYTEEQIEHIFKIATSSEDMTPTLSADEINMYRSAFLYETAKLYSKHGFTAQYHVGAYRSANSVMLQKLGPDTGFDSVDDAASVRSFGSLLDRLNSEDSLPRTLFYPLDINQYEAFATLASNFCGRKRGWVQLGAPWWFNDQYYGIIKQFESVGALYPAALSAGMLTDSRSILSYPRHELYRRALCGYLASVVERGEYFSGVDALGKIIYDVCYGNAKEYFLD
jgi:glucuronate isomerase